MTKTISRTALFEEWLRDWKDEASKSSGRMRIGEWTLWEGWMMGASAGRAECAAYITNLEQRLAAMEGEYARYRKLRP